jgi:hypothetical protein
MARAPDSQIAKQFYEPEYREKSISSPSAAPIDPSPPKPSQVLTETSDEFAPKPSSHRQRDNLEWYGTWEEE